MKYSLVALIISVFITGLFSQHLEVEGKAKITKMEPATASAQPVARESDGTLSLMTGTTTYAVGDFAQGGVVFWVSPSGEHGKVVSIYDIGETPWNNIWNVEIGATAQSEINGAGNTVAIILQDGQKISAAQHCNLLTYGGYDDWYLPSKNELNQMYLARADINATATANGGENFVLSFYWSSSEFDFDTAWSQSFNGGWQNNSKTKNSTERIRAIRAF